MHHVNKYFNQTMVIEALKMSFYKLNPKQLIKNPIMFVVEVGMILTLILICFPDIFYPAGKGETLTDHQAN